MSRSRILLLVLPALAASLINPFDFRPGKPPRPRG
jgi:hypothetical protein